MKQTNLLKLAAVLVRHHKLRKQCDAAFDEARKFTGAWMATAHGVCSDGKPSIVVEIRLSEYLNRFPDAKPELRTWEKTIEGEPSRRMAYMEYPSQYLGLQQGHHAWVKACTPSLDIGPVVTDKPTVQCLPEIAQAFGIDTLPKDILVQA